MSLLVSHRSGDPDSIFLEATQMYAVPVVSTGATVKASATDTGLVPVVVLDTRSRPDLENLIRLHAMVRSGDCESRWGWEFEDDEQNSVNLVVIFLHPERTTVRISFDAHQYWKTLDLIVQTGILELLPGRPGEQTERCLAERRKGIFVNIFVPEATRKRWEATIDKILEEKGLAQGMLPADAERFAKTAKEEWRRLSLVLSEG